MSIPISQFIPPPTHLPVGFMEVLTWEEDAGECQDEARSMEGPEPASAPWESSTIVDALWQLMVPFLGTWGGSCSASATL